jgi:iron complex transport system substrate-binding protein
VRRRLLLVAAALLLTRGAAAEAAAPRRVASLNLTADEVLMEILPPGRLVAVTRFADEAGTSNIVGRVPPSVARFPRADLERLVALAPDLVVVSQYTDADVLRQIEKSGIRWHRMEGLESLAGFRESILSLGRVVGEEAAARALAARYDARLAALALLLEGVKRPRVLYWANPYTAGAHSAIGAIIEGAGAENVGRTLGLEGIQPLGGERAFLADPDVVLVGASFESVDSLRQHPLLGKLRAVREGQVVSMPGELLVTLSHHAVESCWYLASKLHPGLVSADGWKAADPKNAEPERVPR